MSNISPVNEAQAPEGSRKMLQSIKESAGKIPNIFLILAHSPAALATVVQDELSKGRLSAELREQIAVSVAGYNHCDYCASAHTFMGARAGISKSELRSNLSGDSNDAKTACVLRFVVEVLETKGHLEKGRLQALKDSGFSEEEIVEIITHIGTNITTNYFNNVAGTEVDFPLISTRQKMASSEM